MKYIDADRFRAEIEKTYKSEIQPWLSGVSATSAIYDYVLPLIDSLQQEQLEVDLEEEINKFRTIFKNECDARIIGEIANHFTKWGAEHSGSSEIPKDLDEVANEFANKEFPDEPAVGQWGTGDYEPPVDMEYPREIAKDSFIAGAKWQAEQDEKDLSEKTAAAYQLGLADKEKHMMKEAVECMVTTNLANRPVIYLDQLKGFQYGDKVRLIIVKEN